MRTGPPVVLGASRSPGGTQRAEDSQPAAPEPDAVRSPAAASEAAPDEGPVLAPQGPLLRMLIVPLVVRDRSIGALTFATRDPARRYGESDVTVAEVLAQRAAKAMENARRVRPTFRYAESAVEACEGAHLVLHLTEWPEFRQLDPEKLGDLVKSKVIIDGRLRLHAPTWRNAGWKLVQIGRAATL